MPVDLFPPPRRVEWGRGELRITSGTGVDLGPGVPEAVAVLLIQRVHNHYQVDLVDEAAEQRPERTTTITLTVEAGVAPPQGYRLTIGPSGVRVRGADVDGVWNGAHTLWQLMLQDGLALPHGEVHDWPALAVRGALLDVSRDRTPTLDTLRELVELLSTWKINQVQLYVEHVVASRRHPGAAPPSAPITPAELRELDEICAARNVELVPNQATFGHMWRWLRLPRYRHLAECPDGFEWMGMRTSQPFTLNPSHPGSLDLAADLVAEQRACVRSRRVNVNCDETWDLGQGASAARASAEGTAAVYADYVQRLVARLDAEPDAPLEEVQVWGDVLAHAPEVLAALPPKVTSLVWGYEAERDWGDALQPFVAAGRPFLVCPGTSSWSSIGGRTANMRANVLEAALAAEQHGAAGLLVTDWGDGGHWQQYPVRLPGLLMAACQAWSPGAHINLAAGLATTAFGDPSGDAGALLCELGEVVVPVVNGSLLWWAFAAGEQALVDDPGKVALALDLAERADDLAGRARRLELGVAHAAQLRAELELTARHLALGARRLAVLCGDRPPSGSAALDGVLDELVDDVTAAWRFRDRSDGLADSVAKLRGEQPLHELLDAEGTLRVVRRLLR